MRESLEDMAAKLYPDEEVRKAVIAHADYSGTRKQIEKGQLKLPHPQDAKRWHKAMTTPPPKEEEDD